MYWASKYKEYLFKGMKVITPMGDDEYRHGVIDEFNDTHNVYVNYTNKKFELCDSWGGGGLFCLHEDCDEFDDFEIVDSSFIDLMRSNKLKRILDVDVT